MKDTPAMIAPPSSAVRAMRFQPPTSARRTVSRASRISPSASPTASTRRSSGSLSNRLCTVHLQNFPVRPEGRHGVPVPCEVLANDPLAGDTHSNPPVRIVEQFPDPGDEALDVARLRQDDAVAQRPKVLGAPFALTPDHRLPHVEGFDISHPERLVPAGQHEEVTSGEIRPHRLVGLI